MDSQMQSQGSSNNDDQYSDHDNGGEPIQAIVAQIDSYMKDPKLVTPQTLADLKQQLLDLQKDLNNEESSEPGNQSPNGDEGKTPGLMIAISRGMKK